VKNTSGATYRASARSRTRGRTVTDPAPPLIPGERPSPPPELTPPEGDAWRRITGRLPGDYFSAETVPMLKELCRHCCRADELAQEIEAVRAEMQAVAVGSDTTATRAKAEAALRASWLTLLRAHGYQSERVGNLSTKLRLTKFSRYMRDAESAAIAARNAPAGPKPWEDWGDGKGGGNR
jgi:hypothetical protein